MECFTCHEKMQCYDDAVDERLRVDWLVCPRCKSKAEIIYGGNGKYIKKVTWKRDDDVQ